MSYLEGLDLSLQLSLNHFFLGGLIGSGETRQVFEYKGNPDMVLKLELDSNSKATFDNVTEWNIWSEAVDSFPQIAKYLAPCKAISPCGRILMQARTTPLESSDLPKKLKLPKFFADVKRENIGWLNGKIVFHDYGNHRMSDLAWDKSVGYAVWGNWK